MFAEMTGIHRILRVLLFVAASCLVINDCARLAISFNQSLSTRLNAPVQEEENNGSNTIPLFEEEVKHKELATSCCFVILPSDAIEVYVEHLIKDDEVRHLAYLPVFSPPPDLG